MSVPGTSERVARYRRAAGALALATVAVGVLVLVGWLFGLSGLVRFLPSPPEAQLQSAACLALLGLALWLLHAGPPGAGGRHAIRALAGVATLLAVLGALAPGRMAPVTVLVVLLVGPALLLVDGPGRRGRRVADALAVAATVAVFLGLCGYVFDVDFLTGAERGGVLRAGLPTVFPSALLCAGLLLARAERGPMARLASEGLGGTMARRLVPTAAGATLVLGLAVARAEAAGVVSLSIGLAAFAAMMLLGGVTLVLVVAEIVDRVEEDRLANHRLLQGIVDGASSLIYVLDADGRFLLANRNLCALLETRREEVIGKTREALLDPASAAEHRRNDLEVIRARKRITVEEENLQADGPHVYASHKFPLLDAAGEVLGVCGISEDITERRRAEEAIEETNKLLSEFIRHSPIYAYVKEVTPDESKVLVASENFRDMIGIPGSAMAGKTMAELFPPELAAKISADDWDVVSRGELLRLDEELGDRSYATVKFPLALGGKRLLAGFTIDITDRKRAQAALSALNDELEERVRQRTADLEAANRELDAFSYSVSHDLRAPLRAVAGFSRILLEDYRDVLPPEAQQYLDLLRGGAEQMGRLVDDLLGFSRLGRQPVSRERVRPESLVRWCLTELTPAREGRTVHVVVEPLPECEADAGLLRQVWLNLLDNAFKYTRARDTAEIRVGHRQVDGGGAYFVADNGVGFDMAYADKLFGVFQRLHTEEEYEGTGVGLALVQRIVSRHGGRVWAEAEAGHGATFYFTLPGG